MIRVLLLTALLAGTLAPASSPAQCPDGTPPPCAGVRRAPPATRSLAVLTFENLSADSGDVYLAEGLADELSARLGQVSRLSLASRTAVRRLRNVAALSTDEIGRALNVRYLVSGTVRHAGARLRVAIELLRAAGGGQVWSSQYDRSSADLLDIQQDVATQVAAAVAGRLLPAERVTLASRPTASPEAYDAYLRGVTLFHGGLASRQREALTLLERATALDSSFAEAWSLLSQVNSQMFWFYFDRSQERLTQARAAAERAVAIAPGAAQGHIALGYYYYWGSRDYGRALQEFSAALVARPNDPAVHSALSNVARRQGSWDQSLASRGRAIALDPEDRQEVSEQGLTLHDMRRFAEAQVLYDRGMTPPADYPIVFLFAAGLAAGRDGSLERAAPALDFIAQHAEDFVERTFHDPSTALPVWRLPGPHQAALLAARPGPAPEARAQHYLVTGEVLAALHRPEAAGAFDSVVTIVGALLEGRPDDDGFREQLSLALAGLGQCDAALREGRLAVTLLPVSADALTGPQRLQALAEVEAGCGQADSAVAHVTYLVSIPSFLTRPLLRADPVWAPLRADPRFQRLAAEP